jgi:electron transfer flavoprotein beta subunit
MMKIVVCVKTATGAAVDSEDAFQRGGRVGPAVLTSSDAHAVEEALRIVERDGGEVVVVAIAPAEALGAVREALALGAGRAIMLAAAALDGSDLLAVSRALAALLASESADLYLFCSWPGDIDGTLLWAATGERLGLPVLTQARNLVIADGHATSQRQAEAGDLTLTAPLPCMVEVTEAINKPRYPTIKGKLAARSKPLQLVRLADLGLAAEAVGAAGSGTTIVRLGRPPSRRQPVVVVDAGSAPERIIAFLEERRLIL